MNVHKSIACEFYSYFCARSNVARYFFHGFHHKHPMDETRLGFPPAITAILVLLCKPRPQFLAIHLSRVFFLGCVCKFLGKQT